MSKDLLKYIIATTLVVLGWIVVVPAFESPDEQAHLGTVTYVADHGMVPDWGVKDMTQEMYQTQSLLGILRDSRGNNEYTYHPEHHVQYSDSVLGKYESEITKLNNEANRSTYVAEEAARYPILSYYYSSVFYKFANNHDLITRLYVCRLGNIAIIAFMVYFGYLAGLVIFGSKAYAKTLAFMVMLQPMMSFVSAGVNSDNLHNLLSLIIIYFSLRIIKFGISAPTLIAGVVAVACDIYTKPQGFILVPILGLAIVMRIFKDKNYRTLIYLFVAGLAIAVLGWDQLMMYRGFLSIDNASASSFVDYLRFSANKLIAQNVVWYWGVFKWLGVVLPPIYWRIANRLVLLSVVGIAIYYYKVIKNRKTIADPYAIFYLIASSFLYALTIFWFDWQYVKSQGFSLGIQARYFFPTIVPHMAILLAGITAWGWNVNSRMNLRRLLVLLFAALQLGAMWHFLGSYYDLSSFTTLATQLSQYKPAFLKGDWWVIYFTLYAISLIYLLYSLIRRQHTAVAITKRLSKRS